MGPTISFTWVKTLGETVARRVSTLHVVSHGHYPNILRDLACRAQGETRRGSKLVDWTPDLCADRVL